MTMRRAAPPRRIVHHGREEISMSEIDNELEEAQGEQAGDASPDSDGSDSDGSDSTLGAGTTEGADSFGPTDVVTEFESSGEGSDSGTPPEGESDSAFAGETGEFGSARDATTDGNTSAGSDTDDAEDG
jgi:hypothetical protein